MKTTLSGVFYTTAYHLITDILPLTLAALGGYLLGQGSPF